MRRFRVIALALCATLAVAAVAYAAQVNTYTVTASTSPTRAGSKTKPVPVSLKFNYAVGEASNQRPSPVRRYSILFEGMRVNTTRFKKCTAASIQAAQSDSKCPPAAVMGNGTVKNIVGATNNPNDKANSCTLDLKVYNSGRTASGQDKGALFLRGRPGELCSAIAEAIDAKFVRSSRGTALQFDVKASLLHPIAGLDNAVTNVQSSIRRAVATKSGKTYGFFESIGGCKSGKRRVAVTFLTEAGQSKTQATTARCTS